MKKFSVCFNLNFRSDFHHSGRYSDRKQAVTFSPGFHRELPTSRVAGGISMGFDSQCPKVLCPSC
ncbi:MAG: hypothetical protein M1302_05585 [Candidatus Thermoplasmatota archaeon]|nr:hypothetical protein [Candidatus Thermoplasmatota archaeon]